jgi:hypothetical protein
VGGKGHAGEGAEIVDPVEERLVRGEVVATEEQVDVVPAAAAAKGVG